MRAVLDSNVLVSALLFRGPTTRLREHWQTMRLSLVATKPIVEEYARVLAYPKFDLGESTIAGILYEQVLPFCEIVPAASGPLWCRDQDDDKFLHCALAVNAALITGDPDLLDLRHAFRHLRILTPAQALKRLEPPRSRR